MNWSTSLDLLGALFRVYPSFLFGPWQWEEVQEEEQRQDGSDYSYSTKQDDVLPVTFPGKKLEVKSTVGRLPQTDIRPTRPHSYCPSMSAGYPSKHDSVKHDKVFIQKW